MKSAMKSTIVLGVVWALASGIAQGAFLTPELKAKMEQAAPGEKLPVVVFLGREADLSGFPGAQRAAMVQYLKDFADQSQRELLSALPRYGNNVSKVQPFWICNRVGLEATPGVLLDLARRPDVAFIDEDKIIQLEPTPGRGGPGINSVEWNISRVQADRVWRELGFTGLGIVVGNIDTGVDVSHPTFGGRWRGGSNSWIDAVNDSTRPYDDHGHGTHTMGTICGGNTADTIGVARGATFVAAKAFNSGGSGSSTDITQCFQWLANLAGQGAAPSVVGNSWGGGRTDTWTWQPIRNNQMLGIIHVFSQGNNGPDSSTANSPGNFSCVIGVGATDNTETIARFSSRGPAPTGMPWDSTQAWLDPDWGTRTPDHLKPDLSAPGVSIRSSLPGNRYASWNGTSMASPHVTGTVALMYEKNPNLDYPQIWEILHSTVDQPSPGAPYPNQNYGWGRLNAYAAVSATPRPTDPYIRIESTRFNAPPDPGATVNFFVTVRNRGANANNLAGRLATSDPDVTISDAQGSYGNVPTDSIKENTSDPFVLQIRRGMRYHEAVFSLALTANGGAWNDTLEVKATIGYPPPNVIYVSCTVDDPNHNGRIEPGETANVVVTVSNNGQQDVRSVASILSTSETGLRVIQGNAPYGDIPIGQQRNNSGNPFVVSCGPYVKPKNAQFTLTLIGTGSRDSLSWTWTPTVPIPVGASQLLVVNADPGGNFLNFYTAPLDTLGTEYGYHTTTASAVRDTDLAKHVQVIWYTGNDTLNCFTDSQKTMLQNYLNGHGNLFATGKGIAGNLNRRRTAQDSLFLRNILHATYNTNHQNNLWFVGTSGDPIGNGIQMLGFGRANNQNPFNVVNAVNGGIVSLTHQSVPAMVRYEWPDGHREVFFSAGYEGVGSDPFSVGPSGLLKRILDWLYSPPPTGVETEKPREPGVPASFALGPARPNPFTHQVAIGYALPVASRVNLKVYNLSGQVVRTLVSGLESPGYKQVSWDGRGEAGERVAAGIYFYRFEAGSFSATKKLILVR